MGLDTTHNCWHGAYSAFNRWRDRLAEAAGIEVEPYRYENGIMFGGPRLDWRSIERKIGYDLNGKWDEIPVRHDGIPDPLIILLAHSDCEGELQTEFLDSLADRLEELLPLVEHEDGGGHIGNYGDTTRKFIKGLRLAFKRGEKVSFH